MVIEEGEGNYAEIKGILKKKEVIKDEEANYFRIGVIVGGESSGYCTGC
jgi:glutathionylspermidine synthase